VQAAACNHLIFETREQVVDGPPPRVEQEVRVFALRYATSVLGVRRQLVALEHEHRVEVRSQRPG
jgi:hypothetical protein